MLSATLQARRRLGMGAPDARVAAAVVLAMLGLVAAPAGGAQPVAIVTEVDGPVRIVVHGRAAPSEVADPVERDATIVLPREARIVLAYPKPGSIYELRGPGRFVAGADAVQSRSGQGSLARRDLPALLRALRIRPEGTTLQGSAAMRGAGALELRAEGPTGSQLARDAIRLCWRPLGADWSYRVRLIDGDGAVLFEAQTRDAAMQLPSTLPLQPEGLYLWHLLAQGPGERTFEAAGQFRRVDADTEQAMLSAESSLADADATGRALYRIARQQRGLADPPGCASAGGAAPVSVRN
jgi:hypothetical protein